MGRKLIAVVSLCIFLIPKDSSSIGAGLPALEREFQSAIQIWTIENNKPKYLCSGVAIAPDAVVTTASCVYAQNDVAKATTLFISTAQKIDFKIPLAQAIQSVSSIAKKGIKDHENNLMLIFLSQPLSIEPAILLSANEVFQIHLLGPVFFAGFGNQDGIINLSGIQESWRDFWYGEKKNEPGEKVIAKSRIALVSGTELKVGSLPEDGFACPGDEGSPLYAHIDTPFSNSQRVIGITVHPKALEHCNKPTTVLRLDAFREFLNEKMIHECRSGLRTWCQVEGLLPPGYNEEIIREKKSPTEEKVTLPEAPKEPKEDPPTKPAPNPTPQQVPEPTKASKSVSQPQQKTSKRRLNVNAEGAGCSCQQVFTSRR